MVALGILDTKNSKKNSAVHARKKKQSDCTKKQETSVHHDQSKFPSRPSHLLTCLPIFANRWPKRQFPVAFTDNHTHTRNPYKHERCFGDCVAGLWSVCMRMLGLVGFRCRFQKTSNYSKNVPELRLCTGVG